MNDWPILSLVVFTPLTGALAILFVLILLTVEQTPEEG